MKKKIDIKVLIIAILGIAIFLILGFFLFVWKVTNIFDIVLAQRVRPLTCMIEEYRYQLPYSKIEDESISEEDWNTYKEVGKKFYNGGEPCENYEDIVWFNLAGEQLKEIFEEDIRE